MFMRETRAMSVPFSRKLRCDQLAMYVLKYLGNESSPDFFGLWSTP